MIRTVMMISARRLLHNRVELFLTFVVPIAFFSIFAVIFGGGLSNGTTTRIKVVTVDESVSAAGQAVINSLRQSEAFRFMRTEDDPNVTRVQAEEMVRSGVVSLAIVVFNSNGLVAAELLADASDKVGPQVANALVAQSLVAANAGNASVGLTQHDRGASTEAGVAPALPNVEIVDVMGEGKANPVVSMYAAGIAVMFLLFGAAGGGGALLEERESQTLDRLLSTQLSMDQLLLGKWFYLTLLGMLQVTVMFIWGQLVFDIDLLGHLDGFVMVTLVTASAAAAFGLLLATLCKTRGQLSGLSTILILSMSALGGSMVPRYVMSERMKEIGMWTFNAWALDGYDKVFWRDLPVSDLAAQLSVLMFSGVGFLLVARMLATRWEHD